MANIHTLTDYDHNAADFDRFRRPSPVIIALMKEAFSLADKAVLSLGCGTGQYEAALSESIEIVGVDKSGGMIRQAQNRIKHLLRGDIMTLPFAEGTFSGVYFMQSLHHIGANLDIGSGERDFARRQALGEAIRVIHKGPILIIQRDPSQNQTVWFWKYFPRALQKKLLIQPKISTIVAWLNDFGLQNVTATPINDPMNRKFYEPSAPLEPGFRRSFSDFSYLTEAEVAQGVDDLRLAIQNGTVVDDIKKCKQQFKDIGGTVFLVSAYKS